MYDSEFSRQLNPLILNFKRHEPSGAVTRSGYMIRTTGIWLIRKNVTSEVQQFADWRKEEQTGKTTCELTSHVKDKTQKWLTCSIFHCMQLSRAIYRSKQHGGSVTTPKLLLVCRIKAEELKEARNQKEVDDLQNLWKKSQPQENDPTPEQTHIRINGHFRSSVLKLCIFF